jgi:hypothetical protein
MKSILQIQFIVLLILIRCNFLFAQSKDISITVTQLSKEKKEMIASSVTISAIDEVSKKSLQCILIRIDKCIFSNCDNKLFQLSLTEGKHRLQVGCMGYKYSSTIKFKTKVSKLYAISAILKPDTTTLD